MAFRKVISWCAILSCLAGRTLAAEKYVFAHFLVGSMTAAEAVTDIQDAKALGIDAFALNLQSTTLPYATTAVQYLFDAAFNTGFKLFFSFDMTAFSSPSEIIPMLQQYGTNTTYFSANNDGRPFVSIFRGGGSSFSFGSANPNDGWQTQFKDVLQSNGLTINFVPNFDDASNYPTGFFDQFPVVDGVFSWETAWPSGSTTPTTVSDTVDVAAMAGAVAAKKTYMMPLSSLQYKHIPNSGNYYRMGELNLADRIPQVLAVAPDYLEIITWNDSGESHYIGNIWPEAISGTSIPAYTDGYDHKGWQAIFPAIINAYKTGAADVSALTPPVGSAAAGAMWYRALLVSAACANDAQGKPTDWESAQDAVNFAILLPAGTSGVTIKVFSAGRQIGSFPGVAGLNAQMVLGMQVGAQSVQVVDASGTTIMTAAGTMDVAADTTGNVCNFNYQVAKLV